MKKYLLIALLCLIMLPVLWVAYRGGCYLCRNKQDAFWFTVDSLKSAQIQTLDDSEDSLHHLFVSVQADTFLHSLNAKEIISAPFLPTMHYGKFRDMILYLEKHKRAMIAGVTGSGKTTLLDRVARFIAVDESRIMRIECVENLETEYHRYYVGYYSAKGFHPGKMLRFFEQCEADSLHNHVLLIDDIDKIYPSTLFGAALWNELDNPSYKNGIEGYNEDISIPPNLYLISITHEGPGSTIPLNAEHFRRLGQTGPYPVNPCYREYFLHLDKRFDFTNSPDSVWRDAHRLLYFFEKANRMIADRYGIGFSLGQWSDIRKMYTAEDIPRMIQLMLSHVNSFNPSQALHERDFDDLLYSTRNQGVIPASSPVATVFSYVVDVGIFGELGAAIILGLLSLLAGIAVFYRKRFFIRGLISEVIKTPVEYRGGKLSYDEARGNLLLMQDKVRQFTLKRKVNFSEANYLLLTVNEMLKQIEEYHQLAGASADLENMLNKFTEDGILDAKEYEMLNEFLDGMKSSIPAASYKHFKEVIADLYRKSMAEQQQR